MSNLRPVAVFVVLVEDKACSTVDLESAAAGADEIGAAVVGIGVEIVNGGVTLDLVGLGHMVHG